MSNHDILHLVQSHHRVIADDFLESFNDLQVAAHLSLLHRRATVVINAALDVGHCQQHQLLHVLQQQQNNARYEKYHTVK